MTLKQINRFNFFYTKYDILQVYLNITMKINGIIINK